MSINIGDKPEFNVVNVGDELTTDQLAALQNAQGASATNPCLTRTNTFNTTDAAVRITQTGTGDAFVVDDDSGDTTPFRIDQFGAVGIATAGTLPSGNRFTVTGASTFSSGLITISNAGTAASGSLLVSHTNPASTGSGVVVDYRGTADAVRITNTGTGNSFVVEDETNPDVTPFLISASGDVAIGTSTPNGKLRVQGRTYFENTSGGGGNAVLWARSTGSTTVPVGQIMADTAHNGPALVVDLLRTTSTQNALTVTNAGTGTALSLNHTASGSAGAAVDINNSADAIGFWLKSTNSTGTADCVRITNTTAGNSFVVEDSTNPDTSAFTIDANGNIGIGRAPTSRKLEMTGNFAVTGQSTLESSGAASALLVAQSGTAAACVITNTGTGNSFVVNDETGDTSSFVIDNAGNVTLGNYLTLHAGAYSANTAQASVTPDYPHELEFKVGSTTYRVPARAI